MLIRGSTFLQDHPVHHILGLLGTQRSTTATMHYYEEAIVDHFVASVAEPALWRQRYYVDDSQWGGEGSPIFLYIGGEGPQGPPSSSLFMYTQAIEYKALMVSVEHRYYGESRPVPNMTLDNLQYLTADQALADLARFIDFFSANYTGASKSKWLTFGGSYPGALSAWFHLKYPSHAVGAIASSAPVFAVEDYYEYAQVVGNSLSMAVVGGSDLCAGLIENGTQALAALVESTSPMGISEDIPAHLKPCAPINATNDLSMYYSTIYGNLQGTVQYNLEGSSPVVADVCEAVEGQSDGLAALDAATALFGSECIPSNFVEDYIDTLTDVAFSEAGCDLSCSSDRQWIYQSCNSFGYFQTAASEGVSTPFDAFDALTVDTAAIAVCANAFGIPDYAGPRTSGNGDLDANSKYGARNYVTANVTFVNGNVDPWHALGIVNSTDLFYQAGGNQQIISDAVSVVELIGTAHCRDMYAPNAFASIGINDTASVEWAHAKIAADIKRYLS